MTDSVGSADGRTQRQRMLDGDPYIADDPELAADALRARRLQDQFNRTAAEDDGGRRRILHDLLGALGPESEVRPPLYCDYGYQIRIGARVFANFGLVALDVAPIIIGDDVQIASYVQLLTPTHPVDAGLRKAKWESAKPITIGDNVWLGGGVIVLGGVVIGENTVVGAGSVVTRNLPADVVAFGAPARVVRPL